MKILLGPKFRPDSLRPEVLLAVDIINNVCAAEGCVSLTYTSGVDRTHSSGSRHYVGAAVDIVANPQSQILADEIKRCLGPLFDVVWENDHIHIEFDPKTGVNL